MSFNFLNHSFLLWSSPSRKPDLISAFIHIFHCTYSWSYFWVLTDYFIVFYNMQRKLAKTTRQRDFINDSICLRTVSFKSWGEYYLVCSQQSMPTLLHFLFKPTPPKTPSASRSVCQKHMLICGSFWPEFLHRFNFKDSRFLACDEFWRYWLATCLWVCPHPFLSVVVVFGRSGSVRSLWAER